MAIKGSLSEASLPDVLQLLSMGKKSGCLSVTHRQSFGYIYFDKGRICYASIVNRRDRLGDILVKNGLITQAQLDEAVAGQNTQRDTRLGEILVEREFIAREELHRYIRLQIEEAVFYLFTWNQGTFNFEADVAPDEQDFLVSINPESLLLEGARRVDEWSLIEKKIPSFDLVFEVDRVRLADSAPTLTAEQETLVSLVDGKRDVTGLVDESGLVRVRRRESAVRSHHRGLPAPRRSDEARRSCHVRVACGRASQPGRRVLQGRHVRRSRARIPARERAASGR